MLLDAGLCTIYAVSAETGKRVLPPKAKQQFGELTVGFARNSAALQNNQRVDMLVRILRNRAIETDDRCLVGGAYYYIRQVQHKADEDGLLVTDLSLERLMCDEDMGSEALP